MPFILVGQGAYFVTDSLISVGIDLVDGGNLLNSKFCQVNKDEKVVRYTPYEVKEYGFTNGRIFKSFTIKLNNQTTRYFLERLTKGKVNLYYQLLNLSEIYFENGFLY